MLEIICEAWRKKNPELLRAILADEFEWYDSPFEEVITDADKLIDRWNRDISKQENIEVSAYVITEHNGLSVANWRAEFDRNGSHEVLDGVFVIKSNEQGQLTEFRMWWVNKP